MPTNDKVNVALSVPYQGNADPGHIGSLVNTVGALGCRGIPHSFNVVAGCCYIELARNLLADQFLKSSATHLFMVDSDISWSSDDFVRMLELATRWPVVCAAYPMKSDPPKVIVRPPPKAAFPTVSGLGLIAVGGTGLGFTVVQRAVMEKLAEAAPLMASSVADGEPLRRIFACEASAGGYLGEDIKFFQDCWAAGFPVFLDPAVLLGHTGAKTYSLPEGWARRIA